MARALFETALQRQANPGLRLQLGAQQQEAAHRLLRDVGELRLGRQIDQGGGARPRDGGKQRAAARLAVGGGDRIDHLRRVRRIARRRDHAGAARDRRRQRGAVAQRLEIEIAKLRRLDDGQRLAALGDLDAGGDRQRLEADQGANDGRLRIAQHACGHLGVRRGPWPSAPDRRSGRPARWSRQAPRRCRLAAPCRPHWRGWQNGSVSCDWLTTAQAPCRSPASIRALATVEAIAGSA